MGNENQGLSLLKASKSYSDFHPAVPILHNKNQSLAQKLKMGSEKPPQLRASKSYSNFHPDIYDGRQFTLPPTVTTRPRSHTGGGSPNWELEARRIWSEPAQKMTIRIVPQDSPPRNNSPPIQPPANRDSASVPGYRRDTKAFAAKRSPFIPYTPKKVSRF